MERFRVPQCKWDSKASPYGFWIFLAAIGELPAQPSSPVCEAASHQLDLLPPQRSAACGPIRVRVRVHVRVKVRVRVGVSVRARIRPAAAGSASEAASPGSASAEALS